MIQFTHAEQKTVLGQRQLLCRYKAVQKHASDTVHFRLSIADLISRSQDSLAHENSEKGAHPTTDCAQTHPLHCPHVERGVEKDSQQRIANNVVHCVAYSHV